MEELNKEQIIQLKEAYENEVVDILVNEGKVTLDQADFYIENKELFENNVIVYLSVHAKADKELVDSVSADLNAYGCNVKMYEKGTKYDSYMVKNADITIVFPHVIEDDVYVLGKGTETEAILCIDHGGSLYMCINEDVTAEILDSEKTSIADGNKVDWLDTARITSHGRVLAIIYVIAEVKRKLLVKERKIHYKSNSIKTI